MSHPMTSRKKAYITGTVLFLLGLGVVAFSGNWWPGMMLVVGIALAVRQYLLSHFYDMWVTLLVFVGTFVMVEFDIEWRVFLPILFTLGAIYILVRELTGSDGEPEEEREEDINHEIEEEK